MRALILMYHDILLHNDSVPPTHAPYVLTPGVFERQLKLISANSLQVTTVAELCCRPLVGNALALTFDDGHISNHQTALPMLKRFGFKATFFITAGRIGLGDTMNWREIRDLHTNGMEIGSHTLTHRPPAKLDDEELRYELVESRRILEDGLGASVTSVSSPTGFHNGRFCEIAKEVGYHAVCIGRIGLATGAEDCFSLNRIAVKVSLSDEQFERLLRFDPVRLRLMRSKQWLRETARKTLGVEAYLRLRSTLIRASH
jgi:peptidoglycan/xylan/chitin deacetylase (PgdA/CDA1 family)